MDIQLKGRSDKYGSRSQQCISMAKDTKVGVIAQGESIVRRNLRIKPKKKTNAYGMIREEKMTKQMEQRDSSEASRNGV